MVQPVHRVKDSMFKSHWTFLPFFVDKHTNITYDLDDKIMKRGSYHHILKQLKRFEFNENNVIFY